MTQPIARTAPAAGTGRPRRLLVLANRNSGRAGTGLQSAIDALEAAGAALELVHTGTVEELREAVHRHADAVETIVVAGGDGTLNAAAPAIVDAGKPLGILPLGTANDLARTLGLPTDPELAARIALEGELRRIDLGRANDQYFFNAASVGLPVEVARRQRSDRKRRLRTLSYAIAAAEALRARRRFTARLIFDDGILTARCLQVTVGNGVHFGGGLKVAEDAAIDDGRLDVFTIEANTVLALVRVAAQLRYGLQRHSPWTRTFSTHALRLETHRPIPVSTDGEISTSTPVDFSVLRGAIAVRLPVP